MKKIKNSIFAIAFFTILSVYKLDAQVYSLSYVGQQGIGIIYYPNGFYQGQITNGFANGTGTYYWRDGSFFYGNFYAGFQNGPGVLVSRYYGYVTGCWNAGSFIGRCQTTYNPYNNQETVQNLVAQVQSEKPENTNTEDYEEVDEDDYKVTRIDPSTEMGKTLLGKYKND